MTNPTPTQNPAKPSVDSSQSLPSPLRCLSGSLIAGGMAFALYLLTRSITQSFAAKPIHSDNVTVVNIAAAVRTLVIGVSTLGTAIFGIAALGLMALAIQIMIQKSRQQTPSA